jgi:hypothetical protein
MATKMTRAEFYAKYGDVKVMFVEYYKYTFLYAATLSDQRRITVSYGGNGDDIYEHDVTAGQFVKVGQLCPYSGEVYEDGVEVEHFYDY